MERQGETPAVFPRLFREESWRDLALGAVHGPLRQAAEEFFRSAVSVPEDESKDGPRIRQTIADSFHQQLNSDFSNNLAGGASALSQSEADYGVLLMKLASTPSGPARDGLLRDVTLAREKLITKEERAPLTRGLRELIQKAGWQRATGWLKPGSDEKRLQAVEGIILQKLGHQDLRILFEAKEETPQRVLEKFMGEGTQTENEPARELPEEEQIKRAFGDRILNWLKNVNWKFVGRGSASMLAGIGLSELLGSASWLGGVLLGLNMLFRRVKGAEKVESFIKLREAKYPEARERMVTRVAMGTAMGELRAVQAALKVVESPEAMFVGYGFFADVAARLAVASVGAIRQLIGAAGAGGGEQVGGGGTNPADQPSPVEDWTGADREVTGVGGQPLAEQVGPQYPGVVRLPGGETAAIPPEDLGLQPGDAELLAQQAAEAAEAVRQQALEAATRVVEVQPGDTLTELVARAGGDPYGADFTNTVLESADVLTGPQNPHRDMAQTLIEFIKAHPDGVNWRDAINGVGDLAKEMVGGMPLKDAIATATRMIYPGQEMKIVVGAGVQ